MYKTYHFAVFPLYSYGEDGHTTSVLGGIADMSESERMCRRSLQELREVGRKGDAPLALHEKPRHWREGRDGRTEIHCEYNKVRT
jgi:hypothetical protein